MPALSKKDMLIAIRRCARKLGRIPRRKELARIGLPKHQLYKHFESVMDAYREAGLAIRGPGHRRNVDELLLDWAAVARKVGRAPTANDYRRYGKHSRSCFNSRWCSWSAIPQVFFEFANNKEQVRSEWADVLEMAAAQKDCSRLRVSEPGPQPPPRTPMERRRPLRLRSGRSIYGPLLLLPGLAHEPIDETGVIFLFGIVAHRMGFTVLRTQSAFPDCEALREIRPGRLQRVTIEFEFVSRNFQLHGHRPADCDLIVCWRHNWPECPGKLEVIELSRVVRTL